MALTRHDRAQIAVSPMIKLTLAAKASRHKARGGVFGFAARGLTLRVSK